MRQFNQPVWLAQTEACYLLGVWIHNSGTCQMLSNLESAY